jgi:hypothetical protein
MARMRVRVAGAWVDTNKRGKVNYQGSDLAFGPPTSTPVSLFTSQTPAGTFEDGIAMSLGAVMSFAVAGTITHVRWYCPSNPPGGTVRAAVFGVNEARLTAEPDVTFGTLTGAAWNTVALATPLAVPGGVQRVIAIKTPNRYGASTGGSSPFPLTNGPLSVASGGGRFTTFGNTSDRVEYPGDNFNNGCYFIDVVFVPD